MTAPFGQANVERLQLALHAPHGTRVDAVLRAGRLVALTVEPATARGRVVVPDRLADPAVRQGREGAAAVKQLRADTTAAYEDPP